MKISKRQILEEIRSTGGNLSVVAKKYGMSRQGIAKRVEASQVLKAAIKSAGEELLDLAEDGLRIAVQERCPWAIRFALSTLGRDRGYAKTVNIEANDKPGVMHLYFPDDGRDRPDPLNFPPYVDSE